MRNPRLIRKISIGKNREINKKNDNFFLTFLKQEYFYRRDSPSVPLEFPKLANAQPSNFGPLRILKEKNQDFIGGKKPLLLQGVFVRVAIRLEKIRRRMAF